MHLLYVVIKWVAPNKHEVDDAAGTPRIHPLRVVEGQDLWRPVNGSSHSRREHLVSMSLPGHARILFSINAWIVHSWIMQAGVLHFLLDWRHGLILVFFLAQVLFGGSVVAD